jgi:mRNA interferase MazF
VSVERWSIWQANLDPVIGSEQGRVRPVLVISETMNNDLLRVVNVLPITSRKAARRIHPNESFIPSGTGGLTVDSVVLCYQIRTLDKQRLSRMYGTLNDTTQRDEVLKAVRFQLGI